MFDSNQFFSGAKGFYPLTIDQSLRFNDNDSAYLSRTPASAGNRKTWTWSGWVKRTAFASQGLFTAGTSPYDELRFNNDILRFFINGSTTADLQTTQVFRDASAWYHIILAVDTTQATASNRVKIYVNGTQITSFSTANYPSQNTDCTINNNVSHGVGYSVSNNALHFDGYLAEVHFTDGTAYTADAFGEFKSGVWVAKAPSVTYGTNGFYLDFANSADIGNDISGNGNDWTPNNFTASDVVLDSPTDNFATLNPLAKDSDVTLSDGNLKFSCTAGGAGGGIGTIAVSSGKWYWEVDLVSGNASTGIGIAKLPLAGYNFDQAGTYLYLASGSKRLSPSTTSAYGASFADGDVIGVALDMDTGSVEFYKNNVAQGDAFTGLSGDFTFFAQDSSGVNAPVFNVNFGQLGFTYTPPTGFNALSTANLPDPVIDPAQDESPSDYFNTVLYTGNGSTQSITGVGFQPDWVWLKRRSSSANHTTLDAVRGATKTLEVNATNAEETQAQSLQSFDSDGFTLGSRLQDNQNGGTYVAWNWKANGSGVSNTDGSITSTVSANTESGFSISTFTTPASGNFDVGHGLDSAPDMFIVKGRETSGYIWLVYHRSAGAGGYLTLNSTAAFFSDASIYQNTNPDSSLIYGNATGWGGNEDYVCYAFHSVEGFSKFGQYEGGSSPFVYTGFRPALIWIKSIDSTSDWYCFDDKRLGYNVDNDFLELNDSEDEDTADLIDILSNGFKIRGSSGTDPNVSETYIYACWASNPFKYSNAR